LLAESFDGPVEVLLVENLIQARVVGTMNASAWHRRQPHVSTAKGGVIEVCTLVPGEGQTPGCPNHRVRR
jgi:hypothetical protein